LERAWPHASLQLTYLELDTNEVSLFREETSREVLIKFLNETVDEWFSWLIPYVEWIVKRNASTEKAPFPFTNPGFAVSNQKGESERFLALNTRHLRREKFG